MHHHKFSRTVHAVSGIPSLSKGGKIAGLELLKPDGPMHGFLVNPNFPQGQGYGIAPHINLTIAPDLPSVTDRIIGLLQNDTSGSENAKNL